jgi:hypothetical protein
MPDFGRISVHNARESGVEISLLGSGTYDHVGFFGPNGTSTAVEVGAYQDSTIIVDDNGLEDPALGPFGGSGFMTNTKNPGTADTVTLSGVPLGPGTVPINTVNIFDANNLDTEPEFSQQSSGTILIQYFASGVSLVNTFNAKLYGFDNTASVETAPPDITLQGFEINASGIWRDAAHSGVWKTMHGRDDALEFSDHSSANGYAANNRHIWVAAITARPEAVGILDDWDFAFELQFATFMITTGIALKLMALGASILGSLSSLVA